jgi:hypothetical protein
MRSLAFAALTLPFLITGVAGAFPATLTIVFQPATMRVTSTASGNCWTSSIASRRRDAYRCMSGNTIHDPCFTLDAARVACPDMLRPSSGLRLSLTQALPPPQNDNVRNVWMMEFANGVVCSIGTGTVISGYPFYCTGNWVCAAPQPAPERGVQFALCGQPKSAVSVTALHRFRVTRSYR